jgi:hypothetical protein
LAKRRRQRRPAGEPERDAVLQERGVGPVSTLLVDHGWRFWLLAAIVLLALLALLYPAAMFHGEVFASPDADNAAAFRTIGDASLASGHYPLWNPYLFCGMPTFGSLAYVRFVYLPALPLEFLQGPVGLPPTTWLFVHLLFGGLGMVYLLRRWDVPLAGQLLGAVVWILLPKVVAWGVHGHGSKLIAAMYLPWILAFGWRVLAGRGWIAVGGLALLLGLQILRGHVQITYYTLVAVGWIALVNVVWPLGGEVSEQARERLLRTGQLAVGIALGFLIGAVLLLPVREYAALSIRGAAAGAGGGAAYDYAVGWSLAPAELSTLVLPAAAGFGKATYFGLMPFTDYPNYVGFLLLVLATISALVARRRRLAVALGVLALGSLLVAFGRHFVLYRLLYEILPYFNKFRVPSMILILMGLVIAALAGVGLGYLARQPLAGRRFVGPLIGGLAVVGALLLIGGTTGLAEGAYRSNIDWLAARQGKTVPDVLFVEAWRLHRQDLIRIGLVLVTAAAALALARRNETFRRRGLAWVIVALVVGDMMMVDRRIVAPERSLVEVAVDSRGRPQLVAASRLSRPYRPEAGPTVPPDAVAALTAAVGHDRLWPLGRPADDNRFMRARLRSLGGYHPAKLAAYETIRRRLYTSEQPAGHLADWLAGRVVVLEAPLPEAAFPYLRSLGADLAPEPIFDAGPVAYANLSALPRARLVTGWVARDTLPYGQSLEAFLDAIQSGRHDYRTQVVLDEAPKPAPAAATAPLPAPVFVRDGLDEVALTTDAPVPALLLLADMDAPGWRVSVDDEARPLLRADLVLRAVALPAGPHTVRFSYRDPSVQRGLIVSVVGLAGVLVALSAGWWTSSRRAVGGDGSERGAKGAA